MKHGTHIIPLLIAAVMTVSSCGGSSLVIMELPEGELGWMTERPRGAKMCVPAAFTNEDGKIEGEYGYGHIGNRILSPWAFYARGKQTSWLYIR